MINKIFKTILIFTIVVGISLPTNAAVSVSDGSAFVTKAEFAADVNNLSNRMAQLENSLDAKIDSLVSSYLTRNGIWNGKAQTYLINKNEYYTDTGTLTMNIVTPDKTGLLFTYIISNYKHALQCYASSKPAVVAVVNGLATIYIDIYKSTDTNTSIWSNTKTVTWAGQRDTQQDNVSGTCIDYNCADTKDIDYVDTCMCFVQKDVTYLMEVKLNQNTQIHWYDGSDNRTGLSWAAAAPGSSSRTKWNGSFNEGDAKYWGRGSYYKYQIGLGDVLNVY